jgi:alpha-N-acetylglucosamine transferase
MWALGRLLLLLTVVLFIVVVVCVLQLYEVQLRPKYAVKHTNSLERRPRTAYAVVLSRGPPWRPEPIVSTATTLNYLCMVAVLFNSLRDHNTSAALVLILHGQWRSESERRRNESAEIDAMLLAMQFGVGVDVRRYDVVPDRPGSTPTDLIMVSKFVVWTLIEFERVVFFDADVVAVGPCDGLFGAKELLARRGAMSPVNGGFFVLQPSMNTFAES